MGRRDKPWAIIEPRFSIQEVIGRGDRCHVVGGGAMIVVENDAKDFEEMSRMSRKNFVGFNGRREGIGIGVEGFDRIFF